MSGAINERSASTTIASYSNAGYVDAANYKPLTKRYGNGHFQTPNQPLYCMARFWAVHDSNFCFSLLRLVPIRRQGLYFLSGLILLVVLLDRRLLHESCYAGLTEGTYQPSHFSRSTQGPLKWRHACGLYLLKLILEYWRVEIMNARRSSMLKAFIISNNDRSHPILSSIENSSQHGIRIINNIQSAVITFSKNRSHTQAKKYRHP